jgi:hypothetical protein
MPLQKKGIGHAIHVPDFIVKQTSQLQLSEEQLRVNEALPSDQKLKRIDAREIIYPGNNHEG